LEMNMLNVLCFDCGVMFEVEDGTPNPTKQHKECKHAKV
jgi:hypothetical protein